MSKDSGTTYVWPLATVSAVERLRTSLMIDQITLAQYGDDAMNGAKDELTRILQRLAEPLAAVPHPQDCVFKVSDAPRTFQVKVACAWRPATQKVELRGGPGDGEFWSVVKVGDALKYAVRSPVVFEHEATYPPTPGFDTVVYELAGWSEGARCWVYQP